MGCAACALLARGCLARCVSPDPNPTSGTDVYTDDSDLVAVLVHTGHVKLKTVGKTPLLVSLRVCPAQATYTGSERNGLSSRDWTGKHGGVSIKVERCLQHTAGSAPALSGGGLPQSRSHPHRSRGPPACSLGLAMGPRGACPSPGCRGALPGACPPSRHPTAALHSTGMPAPELSMLRPNMSRQIPSSLQPVAPGPGQSFATPPSACIVVFNLSNEPSLKYSLALVADQGTDEARRRTLPLSLPRTRSRTRSRTRTRTRTPNPNPNQARWTSTRLRREVVYLESRHRRFELAHTGSKKGADGQAFDKYSLSQVLRPHSMDHPNPHPHPHPNPNPNP